jgi:hypothetical protein
MWIHSLTGCHSQVGGPTCQSTVPRIGHFCFHAAQPAVRRFAVSNRLRVLEFAQDTDQIDGDVSVPEPQLDSTAVRHSNQRRNPVKHLIEAFSPDVSKVAENDAPGELFSFAAVCPGAEVDASGQDHPLLACKATSGHLAPSGGWEGTQELGGVQGCNGQGT